LFTPVEKIASGRPALPNADPLLLVSLFLLMAPVDQRLLILSADGLSV
jgi:hypothetical protein